MTDSLPQWSLREDRPGVALLLIPAPPAPLPSRCEVVLRLTDESETAFLGPAGWQVNEFLWRSGRIRQEGGMMALPLGQRICGQIEDFTPLLVRLPALGLDGVVVWQGVTPPLSDGTSLRLDPAGGIADSMIDEAANPGVWETPAAADSIAEAPPEPAAEPSPPPPDQTAPEPDLSAGSGTPPVTEDIPPLRPGPKPIPTAASRSHLPWPWLAGGAVLLALMLVAAAWIFKIPPFAPAPSDSPGETAAGPASSGSTSAASGAAPASGGGTAPAALPNEEAHRRGLAAAQSGNYGEARQLLRQPETQGYGPTLLYLGQAADSTDFTPGLNVAPNDIDAIHYYVSACQAGEAEARTRLSRLKATLEERASFGDSLAHETLRLEMPQAETACP